MQFVKDKISSNSSKNNFENIFFSMELKNCQGENNRSIINMYNFSLEIKNAISYIIQ